MNFFKKFFNKTNSKRKNANLIDSLTMLGSTNYNFTSFGSDIYKSDLVRSCIDILAKHSSKASVKIVNYNQNAKEEDKKYDNYLQKLIQYNPNELMNGVAFLYKVRSQLEEKNNAFVYINKDNVGKVIGLYPISFCTAEITENENELLIKFYLENGKIQTFFWNDVAILRKHYNKNDFFGSDNSPILNTLELINTTNQGISNSVKSSANLKGILKSKVGMLAPEDIKKQQERFVKDYLNLENEGGIASLDATQDFIPLSMDIKNVNYQQMKEFRENVYRYFGLNDNILMSDFSEEQWNAFYESQIETFFIEFGIELTNKIYSANSNKEIIFESNRLQYASNTTKLNFVTQMFDRGFINHNQGLEVFNLAPVENGEDRFIRKEYENLNQIERSEQFTNGNTN